jgi:hypothetical protein
MKFQKELGTLIESAKRKIRRNKIRPPSDGMMLNILYFRGDKNKKRHGFCHYQVEYIHDERFFKKPYIAAYGWAKPPKGSEYAPYRQSQEYVPR